jgi:hypothetical protein
MFGLLAEPTNGLLSPVTMTTLHAASKVTLLEILPAPPVSVIGPTVVIPSETVRTGSAEADRPAIRDVIKIAVLIRICCFISCVFA